MLNLDNLGPDGWGYIKYRIGQGDYPSDDEIAELLRGDRPIPRLVRDYIADRLTGKIKLKRGRKRPNVYVQAHRSVKLIYWVDRVYRWQRAYNWVRKRERQRIKGKALGSRFGAGTPHELALEKVGEESGRSVETLRKWLKEDKKRQSESVPGI